MIPRIEMNSSVLSLVNASGLIIPCVRQTYTRYGSANISGTNTRKTTLMIQVATATINLYQRTSLGGTVAAAGGGGYENDSLVGVSGRTAGSAGSGVCSVEGSSVNTKRV
jgi:hypothetical protein